ncbi:helix-turn-helix transcriptional regulator [Paraburkholderia aromaticivorans]|uniref:helix-turn-helix transcriptional regulator n=1 Tax=Paraburkholderia aromaticivorans TaxID=2026199 RepID=UPI0014562665|nr:AlpA family phage regulatory protein [Paraburkholderia aromaticivorans]
MKNQPQPAFYSVREVCQVLGIGRTTLHRLIEGGQFVPKVSLSARRVAFSVPAVQTWIETRGAA